MKVPGTRFNDISGKKFGGWTVIKFEKVTPKRRAVWLCKCTCGNHKSVEGVVLRNVQTRGCGECHQKVDWSKNPMPLLMSALKKGRVSNA